MCSTDQINVINVTVRLKDKQMNEHGQWYSSINGRGLHPHKTIQFACRSIEEVCSLLKGEELAAEDAKEIESYIISYTTVPPNYPYITNVWTSPIR